MFDPMPLDIVEKIRDSVDIMFVPEVVKADPDIFRIMLKPKNKHGKSIALGRCSLQITKTIVHFEHVYIDNHPEVNASLRFLILDMIIDKIEEMAKLRSFENKRIHITTNSPMLPEILLDHGFRIYSASIINSDNFLGIKTNTDERRTNYGFNYLTRFKKNQAPGSKDKQEPKKNRQVGFLYRSS